MVGKLCAMSRRMISNQMWGKIEPLLPPYRTGRPPIDNRNFMEALLWIARTGAPWRDLPEDFGPWKTVYNRFNRWAKIENFQKAMDMLKKKYVHRPIYD